MTTLLTITAFIAANWVWMVAAFIGVFILDGINTKFLKKDKQGNILPGWSAGLNTAINVLYGISIFLILASGIIPMTSLAPADLNGPSQIFSYWLIGAVVGALSLGAALTGKITSKKWLWTLIGVTVLSIGYVIAAAIAQLIGS